MSKQKIQKPSDVENSTEELGKEVPAALENPRVTTETNETLDKKT